MICKFNVSEKVFDSIKNRAYGTINFISMIGNADINDYVLICYGDKVIVRMLANIPSSNTLIFTGDAYADISTLTIGKAIVCSLLYRCIMKIRCECEYNKPLLAFGYNKEFIEKVNLHTSALKAVIKYIDDGVELCADGVHIPQSAINILDKYHLEKNEKLLFAVNEIKQGLEEIEYLISSKEYKGIWFVGYKMHNIPLEVLGV